MNQDDFFHHVGELIALCAHRKHKPQQSLAPPEPGTHPPRPDNDQRGILHNVNYARAAQGMNTHPSSKARA